MQKTATSVPFVCAMLCAFASLAADLSPDATVTRSYRLNPHRLSTVEFEALTGPLLTLPARGETGDSEQRVRELLTAGGLNLEEGGQFFYNERTGILLVRGTAEEQDQVQALIRSLESPPVHVRLQMTIAEIDTRQNQPFLDNFAETLRPQTVHSATNAPAVNVAILTAPQTRVVFRSIEQREGVDLVTAPPVVTISGRQARLLVEDYEPVFDPPLHAPRKRILERSEP